MAELVLAIPIIYSNNGNGLKKNKTVDRYETFLPCAAPVTIRDLFLLGCPSSQPLSPPTPLNDSALQKETADRIRIVSSKRQK